MNPADPALRKQLQALLGPRFLVGVEIGAGGFAHVFEAHDTRLQSKTAVKVLRPELFRGSGVEERFLREARILAKLRHPHIVPILDVFAGSGLLAYLMPLVHGSTLAEHLARRGALPLDEAIRILTEVGDALDFAHRRGILHRDLKPANILLSEGHALLSDFGIARAVEGPDGAGITETGYVLGSPGYLSPEQASASERVDARSDLYSLAVIGYEMIAGQKPFIGSSPDSITRQQMHGAPTPLSVIRASVPAALDAAIMRGLAPNPGDRFATAAELSAACKAALDPSGRIAPTPPAVVRPAEPVATLISSATRRQLRIGALVALTIIAVAAGILWFVRTSPFAKKSEPLAPNTRAWFVVSQVATHPEDPRLAAAIRSLILSTLGQSTTLGALTDQEIAGLLRSAGKPESSTVSPTLARELASRALVRGVLEASLDRVDEGSVLLLKAVDIDSDSTVAFLKRRVARDSNTLAVAERMASDLRRTLEKNANALATEKNRFATEARTVITADFRAWKIFRLAARQANQGNNQGALSMYREVVALDSTFAWAWSNMGNCYGNLGNRDSAVYAIRIAMKYPEKYLEEWRWEIESGLLSQRGDYESNLRLMDRCIQMEPRDPVAWNNRGKALSALGRHEEALASYQRAQDFAPTFAEVIYSNTIIELIALGRLDDARAQHQKISNLLSSREFGLWIALAGGDGPQIEVAARAVLELPDMDPYMAQTALASRLADRGQLADAMRELDEGLVEARRRQGIRPVEVLQWAQESLALAYGPEAVRSQPAIARGYSLESRITKAVQDLVEKKPREARAVARELEHLYADEPLMLERAPDLIDAWAASLERRPRDVIRFARRITDASGFGSYFTIRKPVAMWLLAGAYEDLGEADSAATYYERMLSTRNLEPEELACSALFHAPVRQHLVLVELKRGHNREARAQAEQFVRMFNRPDPGVRPLLDELQSALALSAEAPEASPRNSSAAGGGHSGRGGR